MKINTKIGKWILLALAVGIIFFYNTTRDPLKLKQDFIDQIISESLSVEASIDIAYFEIINGVRRPGIFQKLNEDDEAVMREELQSLQAIRLNRPAANSLFRLRINGNKEDLIVDVVEDQARDSYYYRIIFDNDLYSATSESILQIVELLFISEEDSVERD
jgi:hypothetical protein